MKLLAFLSLKKWNIKIKCKIVQRIQHFSRLLIIDCRAISAIRDLRRFQFCIYFGGKAGKSAQNAFLCILYIQRGRLRGKRAACLRTACACTRTNVFSWGPGTSPSCRSGSAGQQRCHLWTDGGVGACAHMRRRVSPQPTGLNTRTLTNTNGSGTVLETERVA